MRYFEKDAILSGVGISRIGRRTGIPGLELTLEAVRAAIADAGLAASDVDGIATLGDTPPDEVSTELGIEPRDCGTGFDTGGLLSPVMSACVAVIGQRAASSPGADRRITRRRGSASYRSDGRRG